MEAKKKSPGGGRYHQGPGVFQQQTATGDLKAVVFYWAGILGTKLNPHSQSFAAARAPLIRTTTRKSRSTNAFVPLTRSAGNKYLFMTVDPES